MRLTSPGRIVTFYSYKGGTGRSMALANVAWILASRGMRVLTIDWDLEAPGLHRYFRPFLVDADMSSSPGLMEFLSEYVGRAKTPPRGDEQGGDRWFLRYANPIPYAITLRWPEFPPPGRIDLIPAGKQNDGYGRLVNTFDWDQFYSELGGGAFFESVKDFVREEYDYVLIDSRTGVSDTSGICTIQMPDTLVICFTLNNQSIEGVSNVAQSVWQQRKLAGLEGFSIIPVTTRVRQAELERLEARLEYAKGRLKNLARDRELSDLSIPDVAYYSLEEVLATFRDTPGRHDTVLASLERLTSALSSSAVSSLNPPSEEERRRVLDAFAALPKLSGETRPPEPSAWSQVAISAGFALIILLGLWVWINWYSAAIGERARTSAIVGFAQSQMDKNPLIAAQLLGQLDPAQEPADSLAVARRAGSRLIPDVVISPPSPGTIHGVDYSADSRWIASGSTDSFARLWDARSGRLLRTFAGHTGTVYSVAFDHAGKRLVTASQDGTVRVWDTTTAAEMQAIRVDYASLQTSPKCAAASSKFYPGNPGDLHPLYARFSPDEKVILVTDLLSNVIMYPVSTPGSGLRMSNTCFDVYADNNRIGLPVFNPSGTWLATAHAGGAATLFQVQDWHSVPVKIPASASLLALSPDPPSLLLEVSGAAKEDAIILWDTASQRLARTLKISGPIGAAVFSPDRSSVALVTGGTADRFPYVTSLATDQVRRLSALNYGNVTTLAFAPDSGNLTTGTEAGYLLVWKLNVRPLAAGATWAQAVRYLKSATHACLSPQERTDFLGEDKQIAGERFAQCQSRNQGTSAAQTSNSAPAQ